MPVITVNTLAHPGLEVYASLTEAQLRNRLDPSRGIFIAESPKVINVAIEAVANRCPCCAKYGM